MRLRSALAGLVVTLGIVSSPVAQARSYTAEPGRFQANPRFLVTYTGSGTWRTSYHSNPPNPGGKPDTNDAHDSSVQRWSLRFQDPLRLNSSVLSGATGRTSATGRIWHRHIDGLYRFDNVTLRCRVTATTPRAALLGASLDVSYSAARGALDLTALTPVSDVLNVMPQGCPGQSDAIDGFADNYFMPGFSFAAGYGPARWFRSATVSIPMAVLRRASRVTVHLRPAPGAAPPRNCVVPKPGYERCRTTGWWRGTLIFVRQR